MNTYKVNIKMSIMDGYDDYNVERIDNFHDLEVTLSNDFEVKLLQAFPVDGWFIADKTAYRSINTADLHPHIIRRYVDELHVKLGKLVTEYWRIKNMRMVEECV